MFLHIENIELLHKNAHNLYFESAAMIVTLVSVGKYLEGLSKKQTSLAIEELVGLLPKVVIKKVENELIETKLEDVQVGDLIYLKTYEFVALDGVIIEGESFFDESSITGESKLVHKKENELRKFILMHKEKRYESLVLSSLRRPKAY